MDPPISSSLQWAVSVPRETKWKSCGSVEVIALSSVMTKLLICKVRHVHAGSCLYYVILQIFSPTWFAMQIAMEQRQEVPFTQQLQAWSYSNQCHRYKRHTGNLYIRPFPGLVNFVPAVAYILCLHLPAAFSQPGNGLIEIPFKSSPDYWYRSSLQWMSERISDAKNEGDSLEWRGSGWKRL